jgi:1-aminocyclopropane-1-carboxylate deaminase
VERSEYQKLKNRDGTIFFNGKKFLSVPEGGANRLGVEGCMNIVDPSDAYDIIALAQGTTTTSLGILLGSHPSSEIWCFPALKGFNALCEMEKLASSTGFLSEYNQQKHRLKIFDEFHYGGYAKKRDQVINELADISFNPPILLDPIYTGKAFLGLLSVIRRNDFSKKKILFIHTGGVRSNALL